MGVPWEKCEGQERSIEQDTPAGQKGPKKGPHQKKKNLDQAAGTRVTQ
jgi:hypothetical protein